jgi:hypothetical protein
MALAVALTGVNVHDSKVFHTTIRVRLDSPGGELLALEIGLVIGCGAYVLRHVAALLSPEPINVSAVVSAVWLLHGCCTWSEVVDRRTFCTP